MVRMFGRKEPEQIDQKEAPQPIRKQVSDSVEEDVKVVEREITLSLLNDKLNVLMVQVDLLHSYIKKIASESEIKLE